MAQLLTTLARDHAWALWLGAPVLAITLLCLVAWWRGRPVRPVSTRQAMAGHRAYLDALVRAPRGRVAAPVPHGGVPGGDVGDAPGPGGDVVPVTADRADPGDPLATVRA